MAYGDYIHCCKCDVKLIYDGDRSQRNWWVERFGTGPEIECPNCKAEKQKPVAIGEEWKPCVKLPIVVHVREQRKGETHVSTREGITPVKEDDLIMRGVAGEEYPIGRELFNRTYTFDTAPVHASDISQEHVDETAKGVHEFECPRCGHCCREWVGLTDDEVFNIYKQFDSLQYKSFAKAIEAKLKELNV